jgi:hypothetical protein
MSFELVAFYGLLAAVPTLGLVILTKAIFKNDDTSSTPSVLSELGKEFVKLLKDKKS